MIRGAVRWRVSLTTDRRHTDRRTHMIRSKVHLFAVVPLLVAAACSESTSPTSGSSALAAAFLSTPAGFSSTDNTFASSADAGEAWMPDRNAREDEGAMMGGGLGPEFFGGAVFGRGWD